MLNTAASREFKASMTTWLRFINLMGLKTCFKSITCLCEVSSTELPTFLLLTLQRDCFQIPKNIGVLLAG